MSNILIVWELGGGLGHIVPIARLADLLMARGHRLSIVLKDLRQASQFFDLHSVSLFQAPYLFPSKRNQATRSYADILSSLGYSDSQALLSAVAGWRSIFDSVQPDMILFDSAPTALLAYRDKPVKKIVYSIPYSILPEGQGLRSLDGPELEERDEINMQDARLTGVINQVAEKYKLPPLTRLTDLYCVDHSYIYTVQSVDPYAGTRMRCSYVPVFASEARTQKLAWRSDKPKVLAYLKPVNRIFDLVLDALVSLDVEVVLFAPNTGVRLVEKFGGEHFQVSSKPVHLDSLLVEAGLVICNAGCNVISQSVVRGVPLLLAPIHLEQSHNAWMSQKLGYALCLEQTETMESVKVKINDLISTDTYQAQARTQSLRESEVCLELSQVCDEILQAQ